MDTVYLDEVTGDFEFQELCADIFRRPGRGGVETFTTQHKGSDIGIATPEGHIVVECKHQPGSTVGRPIAQKLHSATISFGGIKGIVVTSGRFSDEATEHARDPSRSTPIELVGWHELRKLAHRAGIAPHRSAGVEAPVIYGYRPDAAAMRQAGLESLVEYQSRPQRIADIASVGRWTLGPVFAYRVKYGLVQTFRPATRTLKEVKEHGRVTMIDGSGARMGRGGLHDFVGRAPLAGLDEIISDGGMAGATGAGAMSDRFTIPRREVADIAEGTIIGENTSAVKCRGKNNVTYKKRCVPGRKSVRIADIRQAVMATYAVRAAVLGREITRMVANSTGSTRFVDGGVACGTCRRRIAQDARRGGQARNSRGRLTHARRMFRSCGFSCKACAMTLCPACAASTRGLLPFRRMLCG